MFEKIDVDLDYTTLVDFIKKVAEERMPEPRVFGYQIAVQSRPELTDPEEQLKESTLSLIYDWNSYDINSGEPLKLLPKEKRLKQEMFTETPNYFKNTIIDEVNELLKEKYGVMRGRILSLPPKFCMTYHNDESPRLHIPIKTNDKNFMVLADRAHWFEVGNAYYVDTRKMHTAVNASLDSRIHLVYCLP
jgi:hypothetical protein